MALLRSSVKTENTEDDADRTTGRVFNEEVNLDESRLRWSVMKRRVASCSSSAHEAVAW